MKFRSQLISYAKHLLLPAPLIMPPVIMPPVTTLPLNTPVPVLSPGIKIGVLAAFVRYAWFVIPKSKVN